MEDTTMATEVRENPAKTREQVAKLAAEGKNAKEIAEATGKTLATVYSHLRKINPDAPRKRGRPRKDEAEKRAAATQAKAAKATGTKPAPARKSTPKATTNGNGHANVDLSDLRSEIEGMIEAKRAEVAAKQAEVARLKEMLALTK
jgi:transposase